MLSCYVRFEILLRKIAVLKLVDFFFVSLDPIDATRIDKAEFSRITRIVWS